MAKERALPEVLEKDFIICDNTLNRKGWRLLVAGIDTEGFNKNPICCVQHDTWMMPVGKWKNLKIDKDQLIGTVTFDKNDPDAVKLYWKYEDGFMNAVSLHIIIMEESEEPSLLVQGQRYPTITKSELLEISLVTLPGQKNAVKLSTPEGGDYTLNIINNQKQTKVETKEKDNKEVENLQLQLDEQKKLNAKNLVKLHVQRGVVQEAETEHLTKLAETDYPTVEKMLDARTPAEKTEKTDKTEKLSETAEGKKLNETIKEFTQGADGSKKAIDDRKNWTFLDLYKKDREALSVMQEKEPERYKALELAFNKEAETMSLKAE